MRSSIVLASDPTWLATIVGDLVHCWGSRMSVSRVALNRLTSAFLVQDRAWNVMSTTLLRVELIWRAVD